MLRVAQRRTATSRVCSRDCPTIARSSPASDTSSRAGRASDFPDREETYEAGDAYYVPPGHTPVHYAGAEIVEFSPTEILGETIPVVMRNLEAAGVTMQSGS